MVISAPKAASPAASEPHNEILYFGTLDKRRDGAVRGGWVMEKIAGLQTHGIPVGDKIVFIDSAMAGVLPRPNEIGSPGGRARTSGFVVDFQGTEESLMMQVIRIVKEEELPLGAVEVPREYSYIEITLETPGKTFLMRTSKKEAASCQHWVTVIENQRHFLLNPNIKAIKPPSRQNSAQIVSPRSQKKPVERSVVMVAMVDDYTEREEYVVAKKINYGEEINLGVVKQGGACLIMLDDGGMARIGTQALMGSWDANETCWVECLGSSSLTEVEVSVTCQVVKQNPKPPTSPLHQVHDSVSDNSREWIRKAEEGASIGFLLMAMLVHFMLGVQGFHWSHKACLTAGAALAISAFIHKSNSQSTRARKPMRRMNSSLIPKVQLTMTIHRCRQQVPS